MKYSFSTQAAMSLAFLAMSACCMAAETAVARPVLDVVLGASGLLQGRVIDSQGTALKGAPVSVWYENQQVANTVADENGQFSIAGLRGGVHQVVAGQGTGVYRLWTAEAAPPHARQGAVLIPGDVVVRGQTTTRILNQSNYTRSARSLAYSAAIAGSVGAILADLQEHWRQERRTGVVSPFEFPDL